MTLKYVKISTKDQFKGVGIKVSEEIKRLGIQDTFIMQERKSHTKKLKYSEIYSYLSLKNIMKQMKHKMVSK